MTKKSTLEIEKFLAVRSEMRGLDHEDIISVQIGSPNEAHIRASDLRAVLDAFNDMQGALCALHTLMDFEESVPDRTAMCFDDATDINAAMEKARAALEKASEIS